MSARGWLSSAHRPPHESRTGEVSQNLNSNLVRASLRQIGRDPPDRTPHERSDRTKVGEASNTGSDLLWDLALAGLVVPKHPATIADRLGQRRPPLRAIDQLTGGDEFGRWHENLTVAACANNGPRPLPYSRNRGLRSWTPLLPYWRPTLRRSFASPTMKSANAGQSHGRFGLWLPRR